MYFVSENMKLYHFRQQTNYCCMLSFRQFLYLNFLADLQTAFRYFDLSHQKDLIKLPLLILKHYYVNYHNLVGLLL